MEEIIMKKILLFASLALAIVVFAGCGGDDNPPNAMEANQRHFGEVVAVDGNRITMNVLSMAGGMGGQGGTVRIGGGQGGESGQRVMVRDGESVEGEFFEGQAVTIQRNEDGSIEARDEDGNLVHRVITDEDGEMIDGENRPQPRIAGADAETDRVRVAGGEGGQQMMVTGEMPPFERAGHAMSITIPGSIDVMVGFMSEDTTSVSTLERGDIVLVIFDEEGRIDSIRLLPDARMY